MRTLAVVFASLLLAGCSTEPAGQTYSEAVATYQAEVALLDSLNARMSSMIATNEIEEKTINDKYDKQIKDAESFGETIATGFNDKAIAEGHLAKNDQHIANLRSIKQRQIAFAQQTFSEKSGPLAAEINEQKTAVEMAKKLRDSLKRP